MQMGNKVVMGPIGNQQYDPLRHYTAVEYDHNSGIAVVSNGIQTEATFETYRLLYNTASVPTTDYMEKILDGAGAEPIVCIHQGLRVSLHTTTPKLYVYML